MDKGTYASIRAAQNGDPAALESLTKENTPLIRSITGRFRGRGTEDEDLFQLGAIGFIKAVRAFDLDRGLALSTYAVPMIMGEVRRYLRDSSMLHVSRSTKELAAKALAARQLLSAEAGREVPLSAIAEHLHVPSEEVAAAMEAMQTPESLQKPIGDGDALLEDVLRAPQDEPETATDRLTLLQLLDTGDALEKKIVLYRYFEDKTQSETANLLGLTQVQVSRAEKKAILRLRKLLCERNP